MRGGEGGGAARGAGGGMWKGPEGKKGRGSAGPQVRPVLAVRCGAPLSGTAAVPRLQAL